MKFIKSLFASIQPAFIIKSYLVSAVVVALMIASPIGDTATTVWVIACAILFPFANVVVNDLKAVLFSGGGVGLYLPAILFIAIKIGVTVGVFAATPIIAPIGIIYLLIRGRMGTKKQGQQQDEQQ